MANSMLWRRAALAILLMLGFYSLALIVVAVLAYLPYAEIQYADRVDLRLLLFSGAGVIGILTAIAPRVDRFPNPGPALLSQQHPALFKLIEDTAVATEQPLPRHVYLVPEFNAWVAQRGGLMGIGSERVMGLGLPLLHALTVREFHAVLAHEFGHFYGGDTALGPWLYKTRAAIERTIANLSNRPTVLRKPFEWYGLAFLRITHGVSRQQEFAADALAARLVGGDALVSGLTTIHGMGQAFTPYWDQEIAPALSVGLRLPILDGFRQFVATPNIARAIEESLKDQLAQEQGDPLDTHPPLKERIAAVPHSGLPASPDPEPRAISLLTDHDGLEQELIKALLPVDAASPAAITWSESAGRVWLPSFTEIVEKNRNRLAGLRPEELSRYADAPAELAVRFKLAARADVASPHHVSQAQYLAGTALSLVLTGRGFELVSSPGANFRLTKGNLVIHPFELIDNLHDKTMSPADWERQLTEAGILGLDLGSETLNNPPKPEGQGAA